MIRNSFLLSRSFFFVFCDDNNSTTRTTYEAGGLLLLSLSIGIESDPTSSPLIFPIFRMNDWNMAFNYTSGGGPTSNLEFLSKCMEKYGKILLLNLFDFIGILQVYK